MRMRFGDYETENFYLKKNRFKQKPNRELANLSKGGDAKPKGLPRKQ